MVEAVTACFALSKNYVLCTYASSQFIIIPNITGNIYFKVLSNELEIRTNPISPHLNVYFI